MQGNFTYPNIIVNMWLLTPCLSVPTEAAWWVSWYG